MHIIEKSINIISILIISNSYLYFYDRTMNIPTKIKFMYVVFISTIYLIFIIKFNIPIKLNKNMIECKIISQSYDDWINDIPLLSVYLICKSWVSIKLITFHKLKID